jgi:hypothetical protein
MITGTPEFSGRPQVRGRQTFANAIANQQPTRKLYWQIFQGRTGHDPV